MRYEVVEDADSEGGAMRLLEECCAKLAFAGAFMFGGAMTVRFGLADNTDQIAVGFLTLICATLLGGLAKGFTPAVDP